MNKNRLNPMHIASLEVFCAAASSINFSTAARLLGITPAAVSRSIKRLELRLGVELFQRNTRNTVLTEDGARYYEQCKSVFDALVTLSSPVQSDAELHGTLRVSAPELFANYKLIPLLTQFCEQHPHLHIELVVNNNNHDLIKDNIDLAFRLVKPSTYIQNHLIAIPIFSCTAGIYASPNYLVKYGTPKDIKDLAHHRCINFMTGRDHSSFPWPLLEHQELIQYPTFQLTIFDSIHSSKEAALHGGGLVQLFHFAVEDDLQQKRLIQVLSHFSSDPVFEFQMLYSYTNKQNEKLQCLRDFIQTNIV